MNALPPVNAPNAHNLYEDVDYPRYWESLARQKLDELERALVRKLLPTHGHSIIDIGCGYGRLLDCYANRFEQVVLFDGAESLLRQAQRRAPENAHCVLGDLNYLPFRAAVFDAALMVRVFHHLNHPKQCLHELQRVLCGGGSLVMNYSNKRNIYRVAQYLLGRTLHSPFSHVMLTIESNFFHHHPAAVTTMLKEEDFERPILRGAGMMDKLIPVSGPFARILPSGMFIAPLIGKTGLAPWIFCRVQTRKQDSIPSTTRLEELLACPCCKGMLMQEKSAFKCKQCQITYPIRGGIVDMQLK